LFQLEHDQPSVTDDMHYST